LLWIHFGAPLLPASGANDTPTPPRYATEKSNSISVDAKQIFQPFPLWSRMFLVGIIKATKSSAETINAGSYRLEFAATAALRWLKQSINTWFGDHQLQYLDTFALFSRLLPCIYAKPTGFSFGSRRNQGYDTIY
jgi:hypothetical protein